MAETESVDGMSQSMFLSPGSTAILMAVAMATSGCDAKKEALKTEERANKVSMREGRVRVMTHEDRVESVANYMAAKDYSVGQKILSEMSRSLDLLNEEELVGIFGEYVDSKDANDTVYLWQVLEALFRKNPRLSLDLYCKTNGLTGGAGIGFLQYAMEADNSQCLGQERSNCGGIRNGGAESGSEGLSSQGTSHRLVQ